MDIIKKQKLLVIGNNYDGCLLTGDREDRTLFTEIDSFDFDLDLENYKIKLGVRNAYLIDSI